MEDHFGRAPYPSLAALYARYPARSRRSGTTSGVQRSWIADKRRELCHNREQKSLVVSDIVVALNTPFNCDPLRLATRRIKNVNSSIDFTSRPVLL
jgi:hypothetical protein